MGPINKSLLALNIESKFEELFPEIDPKSPGVCIRWAGATYVALKDRGFDVKIRAGTLNWQIVPPDQDDGISPTHFTYEYSPTDTRSLINLAIGCLPEIHVWNQLGDDIIDMSTQALQLHFENSHLNCEWKEPPPPKYLWGQPKQGTFYKPKPQATDLAIKALKLMNIRLEVDAGDVVVRQPYARSRQIKRR